MVCPYAEPEHPWPWTTMLRRRTNGGRSACSTCPTAGCGSRPRSGSSTPGGSSGGQAMASLYG
ncbi:hypothetical protein ACWD7C_41435 [Streptomyces sp. NPDC005134]